MRLLLLASLVSLLGGCPSRSDGRFCSPTVPCKDPAYPYCDSVTSECESSPIGGEVDLSMQPIDGDLAMPVQPDMATALPDLTEVIPPDLTPMCVSSATCVVPTAPFCDGATGTCRGCTNNSECGAANPVCNSDGSCRKCTASSECQSGVCDLRGAGSIGSVTQGQCAAVGDIVYVDNNSSTTAKCDKRDGSPAKPYCQVSDAIGALGGKAFIAVAGSATNYDPWSYTSASNLTVQLSGPGRNASSPATLLAPSGQNAVNLTPGNNAVINLSVDGLVFSGASDHTAFYAEANHSANGSSIVLTIRNSLIKGGINGMRILSATFSMSESIVQGSTGTGVNGDGVSIEGTTNWVLQNNIIAQSGTMGVYIETTTGTGSFKFNTVALNGATGNSGGVDCGKATTLESSIVAANTQSTTGTQFLRSCSLDHTVTGTDSIGNTGKLSGDPVFRLTSGTADLRLEVTVPANVTANRACCIDKVSTSTNTLDVERNARPIGASFDVGADEAL